MAKLHILRPFGTFCGHLVHFFCFGTLYRKNLATLDELLISQMALFDGATAGCSKELLSEFFLSGFSKRVVLNTATVTRRIEYVK
jgi:hypothetical protein